MAEDVTRFRLSVLRESFQHTRATLALVWRLAADDLGSRR